MFGRESAEYRTAVIKYRSLLRLKKGKFVKDLENTRLSNPVAFFSMLKVASAPVGCSRQDLLAHYEQLLSTNGEALEQEV
jgi:hypothetical protein